MSVWRILGRHRAAPLAPDWQRALAARLGQRPRRLGRWAELALYGALQCLEDAGETRLPEDARLSVCSVHGPDLALRASLAEARNDLPMPIGFLQSQPSQLLPTLALHLKWRGDGRCLSTRDPLAALHTMLEEAIADDLLLGWISEDSAGETAWLRLRRQTAETSPTPAAMKTPRPLAFADLWQTGRHFIVLPMERGGKIRALD